MSGSMRNRFGIVWALPCPGWRRPLLERVQMAIEQGIPALELGEDFLTDRDEPELERVRREAEAAGLILRSVHFPFGRQHDIASLDQADRSQTVEWFKRLLGRTACLGVPVAVLHPFVRGSDSGPLALFVDSLRRSLEALLPEAERLGVTIGLENMLPKGYSALPAEWDPWLDEFDSPALGTIFDTGHAHIAGCFDAMFERLKPRLVGFHLADNTGEYDWHFQCGYGTVPWDHFFTPFAELDWDHPILCEARPWAGADAGRVLLELDALANTYWPDGASGQAEGGPFPTLRPPQGFFAQTVLGPLVRADRLQCPRCTRLIVFFEDHFCCGCGEFPLAYRSQGRTEG